MRIVANGEMQRIDRWAQRRLGITGLVLMENAGRGCADVLEKYFPVAGARVLIFCGPGNNGGDGFVIGRHLVNRGAQVRVVLVGRQKNLRGDALANCRLAQACGIQLVQTTNVKRMTSLADRFRPDIVVDALFGTGFAGAPRGVFAKVIELINDLDSFVLSVDIPSGINGDTGQGTETAVMADATATMCLPKTGHFLYPGRVYGGDLWLVDIGVPYPAIKHGPLHLLTRASMRQLLPFRMPEGNKGTFGYVLVVAGARGYSGAAGMAARAALKVGAGLVRLAVPSGISNAVEAQLVEVVKVALEQTKQETIAFKALDPVLQLANQSDVAVIGPGITTNPETRRFVRELLAKIKIPFVLDADGLNCVADQPSLLRRVKAPKVLTPHPGELARFLGIDPALINEQRIEIARRTARAYNAVVVLKGAPTIVAEPTGTAFLNPTGNSGLASAGSGDVLAGMIAGFMAQMTSPFEAAALGVYLHGKAADLGIKDSNEYSLTANDLFTYIPRAINHLTEEKDEEEDPALISKAPPF